MVLCGNWTSNDYGIQINMERIEIYKMGKIFDHGYGAVYIGKFSNVHVYRVGFG